MSKYKQTSLIAGVLAGFLSVIMLMLPLSMYAAAPMSFAKSVQPILKANCLQCHQPGGIGYERSGLDMRTYKSLMKGTKYGKVILPGNSYNSVLVQLIEHRANPTINMPYHKHSLTPAEIDTITKWIDEGAKP